jgi:hypothetical protein
MATVASSPPRSPDKHSTLKKVISEVAAWLEPPLRFLGGSSRRSRSFRLLLSKRGGGVNNGVIMYGRRVALARTPIISNY